jgi:hypothetical protein
MGSILTRASISLPALRDSSFAPSRKDAASDTSRGSSFEPTICDSTGGS